MKKLFVYLFRISITPMMIAGIMLPVYFLGWIESKSMYIGLLLFSGILGQIIEHYVHERYKKKNGLTKKKKEEKPVEEEDPLSKLPPEVQELIREGESIQDNVRGDNKNEMGL